MSFHSLALQIYYAFGYSGLNSLVHYTPDDEIIRAITRAIQYLGEAGAQTKQVSSINLKNTN